MSIVYDRYASDSIYSVINVQCLAVIVSRYAAFPLPSENLTASVSQSCNFREDEEHVSQTKTATGILDTYLMYFPFFCAN